jgi:hypothetical protein
LGRPLAEQNQQAGFLFFALAPYRGRKRSGAILPLHRGKGDAAMAEKTGTTAVSAKAAGLGISLDAWAVALALGLALLVWLGWIKHVTW